VSALHLACAADERYVPHSAAMIHSVLAHGDGADVHVHYLRGPAFPAAVMDPLREMVEGAGAAISFPCIPDEDIAGMPTMDRIPSAMWYRIFLPELLPGVDRVLYLDADTIAVDSLRPLTEMDLSGCYVAAVTNVLERHYLHRPAALGLRGPQTYFNSGVILMNLELMRRDGCTEALRECAIGRRAELQWPDQDALNIVLGPRRRPLHPRWNCMNSVLAFPWAVEVFGADAVEEARRNPAIRHFEGPGFNKPWHYLADPATRETYMEHRRATPWPELDVEGRTPANAVRRVARRLRGAYM
jgi:lipopolysaccharide biosynthesis glycosyltransferase